MTFVTFVEIPKIYFNLKRKELLFFFKNIISKNQNMSIFAQINATQK